MKIVPVIHSSFPRIGENPEQQKLRRAFAGLEDGKITEAEFAKIQDQAVDDAIAIQEKAGIEVITDGLIRWYDPASHLARNLKGFEINGLLRFFDTNFYYRQPVAHDDIAGGNGNLQEEISYVKSKSGRKIKAVMLGPLSLASMSLNKSRLSFENLCLRLGEILGREAAKMASAGADFIQIEEPALARNPQWFELFRAGFANLVSVKEGARLILTFYFGNAGKIIERLGEMPADMIGIDFTYSPGLMEKIRNDGSSKPISFGIVDGRNTRIESADEIARVLEPILKKVSGECHVSTSCGLEFLPRAYAVRKLELTSRVAGILNG